VLDRLFGGLVSLGMLALPERVLEGGGELVCQHIAGGRQHLGGRRRPVACWRRR
jgi:hypothetical protein